MLLLLFDFTQEQLTICWLTNWLWLSCEIMNLEVIWVDWIKYVLQLLCTNKELLPLLFCILTVWVVPSIQYRCQFNLMVLIIRNNVNGPGISITFSGWQRAGGEETGW